MQLFSHVLSRIWVMQSTPLWAGVFAGKLIASDTPRATDRAAHAKRHFTPK